MLPVSTITRNKYHIFVRGQEITNICSTKEKKNLAAKMYILCNTKKEMIIFSGY